MHIKTAALNFPDKVLIQVAPSKQVWCVILCQDKFSKEEEWVYRVTPVNKEEQGPYPQCHYWNGCIVVTESDIIDVQIIPRSFEPESFEEHKINHAVIKPLQLR